jgi:hypothetical protein
MPEAKTMDDEYGDGSDCIVCEKCGLCIGHGDCKNQGCGEEIAQEKGNEKPAFITDPRIKDVEIP